MASRAKKQVVVPSAGGYPFSNAVRAGDLVFVSGQMAFMPDGSMSTGSIEAQTKIALDAVKAILTKAGCTMADVVKCGCTLQDARDFAGFNTTYAGYFPKDPPVRSTVVVSHVLDGRVEIDCVAFHPLD